MVIHGVNLKALRALMPRHDGRVNRIYIDPPYNIGNEGWIYNDNDPRIKKWLRDVVGKEGDETTARSTSLWHPDPCAATELSVFKDTKETTRCGAWELEPKNSTLAEC